MRWPRPSGARLCPARDRSRRCECAVTMRQRRGRRRCRVCRDVPGPATLRLPETRWTDHRDVRPRAGHGQGRRPRVQTGRRRVRRHQGHRYLGHGHRDQASTHREPGHPAHGLGPSLVRGPDRHSRGRYRRRRRCHTGRRHTGRRAVDGVTHAAAGTDRAAAVRPDRHHDHRRDRLDTAADRRCARGGQAADLGRRGRTRTRPGTAPLHRGRRTRGPGTSRDRRSSGQNPSTRASGRRQASLGDPAHL